MLRILTRCPNIQGLYPGIDYAHVVCVVSSLVAKVKDMFLRDMSASNMTSLQPVI